jgi:solute carrier family 35 protein F1/2
MIQNTKYLTTVLAICITSTNTLSTLLANEGTSIPAFQSFFNYVLLNLIYTSYTIYKYGFKRWVRLCVFEGWRFIILAFFDVEGNYFVVLAYRYTTILSAQLINFFAIVVVVIISFCFLRVRYHYTQIFGILCCIGGLGVIFGSDHITGANNFGASNPVKGDLFALLGAALYGLSNVLEEFLVSEKPLYEVVGQLAFWGMFINGAQAGIFDRASFRAATWNSRVGGYLTGYTFILTLFYSLAPLLFRLSSAAFFNISLLTGSFWGVAIGVKVFHLGIHWMYPIAFVLIILGQVIYFLRQTQLGDALKPWLGEDQGKGHAGLGTARRRVERPDAIV